MSVAALTTRIADARADGRLSLDEAESIVSPNDPTFKSPGGIGTFMDKDEFELIKTLRNDVASGALVAEPGAKETLDDIVAKGPDSRLKHILKGGPQGGLWRKVGAFIGAVPGGMAGAVTGFFAGVAAASGVTGVLAGAAGTALVAVSGIGAFLLVGVVTLSAYAAAGAAAGHVAGMIHGTADD